jgi:hypothetical protein
MSAVETRICAGGCGRDLDHEVDPPLRKGAKVCRAAVCRKAAQRHAREERARHRLDPRRVGTETTRLMPSLRPAGPMQAGDLTSQSFWRQAESYGMPGSTALPYDLLALRDDFEEKRAAHLTREHERALREDHERARRKTVSLAAWRAQIDDVLVAEVAA